MAIPYSEERRCINFMHPANPPPDESSFLIPYLYAEEDLLDVIRKYQQQLSLAYHQYRTPRYLLRIPALKKYEQILSDPELQKKFVEEVEILKRLLKQKFPWLHFCIQGRLKSFISYENKVTKHLDDGKSTELGDIIAFRIVIRGKKKFSEEKLVEACYSIANTMLEYYLSLGYYFPCTAEKVRDTIQLSSELLGKIYIPRSSGILPEYVFAVKDYIITPKENGYQSLHLIFRNLLNGITFEVQIRTYQMNKNATEGYGDHGKYKESKYNHCVEYDPRLISLKDYSVSEDGVSVTDSAGLDTPRILFFYTSLHILRCKPRVDLRTYHHKTSSNQ